VRVAEVVAALSLASDLGTGEPQVRALRSCLVVMRLAELIGVGAGDRVLSYYLPQLVMLGCTADSTTASSVFGDEVTVGPRMSHLIFGPQMEIMRWVFGNIGVDELPIQRARSVTRMMAYGAGRGMSNSSRAHCEVARHLAGRLELAQDVLDALDYSFERWDGTGAQRVKGERIPLAIRIAHLAWDVEVGERMGGAPACIELVRHHRGSGLDPDLVDRFCPAAADVLAGLDVVSVWDAVIGADPEPARVLTDDKVDTAASIFADFADFKSAYTSEHSRRVADLAANAAQRCGLDPVGVALVRRAGLVRDVGRVAVPASVWDRPGPLRDAEVERVRLVAYHSERILRRAGALAPAGAIGSMHHERLDGSGYYRGVRAV
jgi:HD-GYP domain-containing protein (c-di-GMP phosphodiesterase class II)